MEAKFYKVTYVGDQIEVNSKKDESGKTSKRTVCLQELGGEYENHYVCSCFGAIAGLDFKVGNIVVAALSFRVNNVNGALFQDVIIRDVFKAM